MKRDGCNMRLLLGGLGCFVAVTSYAMEKKPFLRCPATSDIRGFFRAAEKLEQETGKPTTLEDAEKIIKKMKETTKKTVPYMCSSTSPK